MTTKMIRTAEAVCCDGVVTALEALQSAGYYLHASDGHCLSREEFLAAAPIAMNAALRVAADSLVFNGWQPIATAPFGEDVLVFFPELSEEYRRMICHRFEEAPDDWYQQDVDQCPRPVEDEPTYWMPVPQAPVRDVAADTPAKANTPASVPNIGDSGQRSETAMERTSLRSSR